MNLSPMPKWHGTGCLNTLRPIAFRRWQCSNVSTRRGVLGVCYVGGGINILSGTREDITDRLF